MRPAAVAGSAGSRGGAAGAGAPASRASSRSIRASSAFVDGSCAGSAAFTSASSSWVRASAPSFSARSAAAISSSSRTTSPGATVFACAASRSSCSGVTRSSAGTSPSACTTISAARVGLEVAEEAAEVAAGVGQPRGGEQRRARVAGGDGVDRAEQQVGVGGAEHGQHVLERDAAAGVGDELLERAERVAERAGGRARDQRASPRSRISISSASATRRSTPAICGTLGRAKSNRWQRSTTVGSTLFASVVASTKIVCGGGSSSVFRNAFHAAVDSMCASSRM